MSMLNLKIIAIITMTIDHLGVFIFPQLIIFRIIGRLSFIIFAFLIANGFKYTSNYDGYLVRLLVMAFICQIPDMLFSINYPGNIFFGLSLGLISLRLLARQNIKGYLYYFLLLILAIILNIDYGVYGILMIDYFYLIDKYNLSKVTQIIVFICLQVFGVEIENFAYITYSSIISLFLVWQYNENKGYANRMLNHLFYLYYPVHIGVIVLVKYLFLS